MSEVVVAVIGELDAASVADWRDRLDALIERNDSDVLVELGEVTFIDSSGLGLLVGVHKRALQQGCALQFTRPPDQCWRAFTITALDEVLPFVP
jgi:anti-sigma B factor antagonist